MIANNSSVALSTFGFFIVLHLCVPYTHSAVYFNEPVAVNVSDGNDSNGGDYVVSQLNLNNSKLQRYVQRDNQYKQNLQQQKSLEKNQNFNYFTSPSTVSTSSMVSTKSSSAAVSLTSTNASLHSAFIYKAVVPMHSGPEANKVLNAVKLSSASPVTTVFPKSSFNSNETNNAHINPEKDEHFSNKTTGSSVVTSVSVILNGNEPEFTDALGQKVPKPQLSLQVASPIDLLNPDRYEFYTFDDHGELIKRLMTIEEIQSIVANGDDEGPTIIHHSSIEYRDPEKNVQDIVDSVQSVLNKEVEYNKKTSTENLMAFDTPDVSSSWSMILPAVFGNTGSVDIFSHQKPQQIVMTPDSEIMEISTKVTSSTTKKSETGKRKPGQKRKYPATTTEVTPQVIQEELDSQESVYTGMQQYHNIAATMHSYDGISKLHIPPVYHKLPEIETTSHRVLAYNKEAIENPVSSTENYETVMNENISKKPSYEQHKPLSPHRDKKPNRTQATTKRPQTNKKKIKTKPTLAATTPISPIISTTIPTTEFETSTTKRMSPSTLSTSHSIAISSTTLTTKAPKKKKKRPASNPLLFNITTLNGLNHKQPLEAEKRKPSSKPHSQKPKPIQEQIKYPHVISAQETVHQEISYQQFPHVPQPKEPMYSVATSTTPTEPSTTIFFSPTTTPNGIKYASLIVQDFEELTTQKTEESTLIDIPSIYGTSGYPVPSDEPENFNFLNYKQQPLLSLVATQQGNKPYEQDSHTLQSLDQILQSLKPSVQISEQFTGNTVNVSEKLNFKTLTFDSDEYNMTLKPAHHHFKGDTLLSNSELSTPDITSIKYEGKPYHNLTTALSEGIITNKTIEEYTTEHVDDLTLTSFHDLAQDLITSTELPESEVKQTTEYVAFSQQYFPHTNNFEQPSYSSASSITEQLTPTNVFESTTKGQKTEDYTDQLTTESNFLSKIKDEKYAVQPQLNMEVVKPSEEITMSYFQTHSATVASILIYGIPADYRNDTSDEIDLLLSQAIPQISNNNQDNQFNYNRFANHDQLDLPFLKNFAKVENQIKNSTNSNTVFIATEINKPTYERVENTQTKLPEIETLYKESIPYISTTEIPGATSFTEAQSQEFIRSEEATTEPHTTKKNIKEYQMDSAIKIKNICAEEQDKVIANDIDIRGATLIHSEKDTTSENIKDERKSLLVADSFINNKTPINDMFEETTSMDLNKDGQKTVTEMSRENFESVGATGNASGGETNEAFKFDYRKSQTEPEPYRIATDRIIQSSNKKLEQSKESKEDYSLVEIGESTEFNGVNQMSKETSLISEEEETNESIDEDSYIKLGETTTLRPELNLEMNTTGANFISEELKDKDYTTHHAPPKLFGTNIPIQMLSNVPVRSYDHLYEEPDEEDEDDQLTDYLPKSANSPSIPTFTTTAGNIITTYKPEVITTHRLNTLRPVSYFNKPPTYALYQEPVEPFYNKNSPHSSNQKETAISKVVTYSVPTLQQRPMQRPPQLNNLMISATQFTRTAVKLEPSPSNSKGLEASLGNLDKDISAFAKLCNELAFSFWTSITSEKISSARSLVISPFALTSMLSMVFLGARGSTSSEMNDVLKLDDMVTFNPHLVFKNITDSVEKSKDSDIATTAFVREIYSDRSNGKVLQFYKEKSQQLYSGHVEEVNFNVVNDIIRRRTNLLVKRHTMGKVLEYLRTNSVWVNGPLATISANLFQTDCSQGSTKDRDGEIFFQVHPTVRQRRLIPIPAVLFRSGFTAGYEPNLDATVIAFGHIQDTSSVIYVMPNHLSSISPSDNLDRLEKQLMETAISKNAWGNLLTALMDRPTVEVQIPRFSHRSFVNATAGLRKLGLKGLFKSDYADLGGFTGSSNRDIYLSDMIQINTFSTCGEEKIADHHHVEMYPAPPLRKRNKNFDTHGDYEQESSEASIVKDPVLGRGFYDDLLDPKYLELPLPLRPRQARVPEAPRLRLDKPFLYFVRHNPSGIILFMGRFNPRLMP